MGRSCHNAEGYCLHLLTNSSRPSKCHNSWEIRPQGRGYGSLDLSARARVNAFYRFVNPGRAPAWRELLPPALGADRSLNPVSIESKSTISWDPTATASRRFDSRAEIRGDNCDSPRQT